MSDQVNVGDYSLEISGDEVVVRDESGAIVETVELDDVDGELTLPDGQKVDLASILADAGVENFQTAAGPANDNLGNVNGGPGTFTAFHSATDEFGGLDSAGTLGGTSLGFSALNSDEKRTYDPSEEAPVLVTWSPHDAWSAAENEEYISFGKIVTGNPADFAFEVSDDRFEIVDGVLQLRDGVSFDYEAEAGINLEVTATSRTGDVKTIPVHIEVTDVNEAQTDFIVDGDAANENVAGAVIADLTVADPDQGDQQTYQVSDSRFEVVDGQLKLKDDVALDHESEPTIDVTIIATDQAGHQILRTVTIQVGDANEGQTSLSLIGDTVAENAPGAVIGTVIVADPDAGDSQSFQVSDGRFEVVDGQLKLKDGVSLDRESEPSVNVTVTATDSAGHQIQQTFAINVGDVNEAQTALSLDSSSVGENDAGAVIGTLTVADPDAGDSQSFQVSDGRFEVVD
ncbi:MAG TPA: cadherin repeat domain-containing protein, partial [Dongiaceae bacterium]|nr:cadherin repeat domain-containing protein [Dongiaceae bacterium]